MTKRFFTCPIKALYMMKEFGVKFELQVEVNSKLVLGKFVDFPKLNELISTGENAFGDLFDGGKIYVCKESEAIFEPKEEDITIHKNGISAGYFSKEYGNWCRINGRNLEIIMRDSKPFFDAEVE